MAKCSDIKSKYEMNLIDISSAIDENDADSLQEGLDNVTNLYIQMISEDNNLSSDSFVEWISESEIPNQIIEEVRNDILSNSKISALYDSTIRQEAIDDFSFNEKLGDNPNSIFYANPHLVKRFEDYYNFKVVKNLLYDEDTGITIDNTEDLEEVIRSLKSELFDGLTKIDSEKGLLKGTINVSKEDGKITSEQYDIYKKVLNNSYKILSEYTGNYLNSKLAENIEKTALQNKLFDVFILNNFDKLLNYKFNKVFNVNRNFSGTLNNSITVPKYESRLEQTDSNMAFDDNEHKDAIDNMSVLTKIISKSIQRYNVYSGTIPQKVPNVFLDHGVLIQTLGFLRIMSEAISVSGIDGNIKRLDKDPIDFIKQVFNPQFLTKHKKTILDSIPKLGRVVDALPDTIYSNMYSIAKYIEPAINNEKKGLSKPKAFNIVELIAREALNTRNIIYRQYSDDGEGFTFKNLEISKYIESRKKLYEAVKTEIIHLSNTSEGRDKLANIKSEVVNNKLEKASNEAIASMLKTFGIRTEDINNYLGKSKKDVFKLIKHLSGFVDTKGKLDKDKFNKKFETTLENSGYREVSNIYLFENGESYLRSTRNANNDQIPFTSLPVMQETFENSVEEYQNKNNTNTNVFVENKKLYAGTVVKSDINTSVGSFGFVQSTPAEYFTLSFNYDFIDNVVNNKRNVEGDDSAMMLIQPCTFSDKSQAFGFFVDLNKKLKLNNIEESLPLIQQNYSDIVDIKRKYLHNRTSNILNNIIHDYKKLIEFKKEQTPNGISLNPNDVFLWNILSKYSVDQTSLKTSDNEIIKENDNQIAHAINAINDFIVQRSIRIEEAPNGDTLVTNLIGNQTLPDFLIDMIRDYNKANPTNPIELKNEVHFSQYSEEIPIRKNGVVNNKKFKRIGVNTSLFGDFVLSLNKENFQPVIEKYKTSYIKGLKNYTSVSKNALALSTLFKSENLTDSNNNLNKFLFKMFGTKDLDDSRIKKYKDKWFYQYNSIWYVRDTVNNELNPIFEKHFIFNSLFGEEFLGVQTGTYYQHASKNQSLVKNLLDFNPLEGSRHFIEEGVRTEGMSKRMVQYPATKDKLVLGLDRGTPDVYKCAFADDIQAYINNMNGKSKGIDAWDGSSLMLSFMGILEERSVIGKSYRGDKKPIGVSSDYEYGSSKFLKYASFMIDNSRIRNSIGSNLSLKKLFKKMTNFPLSDPSQIVKDVNESDLGKNIYYRTLGENRKITKLSYKDGIVETKYIVVNKLGIPESNIEQTKNFELNTVYDLWNLFGGENSLSFTYKNKSNDRYLTYSNNSQERIADLIARSKAAQSIKYDVIAFVAQLSACKSGAANVNPERGLYDDDFELITSSFKTNEYGFQLDAYHAADDSDLTEPSQMFSALEELGKTHALAKEVYTDLQKLINKVLEGYIKIGNDHTALYDFLNKKITESFKTADKLGVGDIILANIKSWGDEFLKNNPGYNKKQLLPVIDAFSSQHIAGKFVSDVISTINKSGIRRKYAGLMGTLAPSYGHVQLYRINGKIMNYTDVIKEAEKWYKSINSNYKTRNNILKTNSDLETVFKKFKVPNYEQILNILLEQGINNDTLIKNLTDEQSEIISRLIVGDEFDLLERITDNEQLVKEYLDIHHPPTSMFVGTINQVDENTLLSLNELSPEDIVRITLTTNPGFEASSMIHDKKLDHQDYVAMLTDPKGFFNLLVSKSLPGEIDIDKVQITVEKVNSRPTDLRPLQVTWRESNGLLRNLYTTNEYREVVTAIASKDEVRVAEANKNYQLFLENLQGRIDRKEVVPNIQAYEAILPKIYKSKFGLEDGESLNDILSNPNYFKNKLMNKLRIGNTTHVDFIFRGLNGEHVRIALLNPNLKHPINKGKEFDDANVIERTTTENGKSKRFIVDINGSIKYELPLDSSVKSIDNNEVIFVKSIKDVEIIYNSVKDKTFDVLYLDNNEHNQSNEAIEFAKKYSRSRKANEVYDKHKEYLKELFVTDDATLKENIKNTFSGITESQIEQILPIWRNYNALVKVGLWSERNFNKWEDVKAIENINHLDSFIKEADKKNIISKSAQMLNSFKESLTVMATRIPSQSMQSFMKMKVVGFTEDDGNSVYVNAWQTYLQGSDFNLK